MARSKGLTGQELGDVERVELPDGEVWLVSSFLSAQEAAALFVVLRASIPWEDECIRMFGREHRVPRRVCWLGEPGVGYRYSGNLHAPKPWPLALRSLLPRIEAVAGAGVRFNGALANLYRGGSDRMGWHADDEPELGPLPVIASLSLGAARRFQMKHRTRPEVPRLEWLLEGGSLLVMAGPTQRCWLHQVPATRTLVGERINLTFRWIVAGDAGRTQR